MPKHLNFEQGSLEWKAARAGVLTASRSDDAIGLTQKGKPTAGCELLLNELIVERLTGLPTDFFVTRDMQWGIDSEPFARAYYEELTGNIVETCGLFLHDEIEYLGASPDGLIGKNGTLEIKCPKSETHISYLRGGVVPEKYKPQMLCQLVVTGREWCDFLSYDSRLTEDYCSFLVRYTPTKEERQEFTEKCKKFLNLVRSELERIRFREAA